MSDNAPFPPFDVQPLDPGFGWGAIISGLSIDQLDDPAFRRALYDIWIDKGVLLLRGIDGVREQLALSRIFGPLRDHPSAETVSADRRELIDVRYEPLAGQLSNVHGEMRGQALPWHSDLIYVDKINRGGILRPISLPSHLGETGFVDKISAYDALPGRLKRDIEDLHVVYKYDMDFSNIRFGADRGWKVERYSPMAAKIQSRIDEYPRVIHPLVFEQPETGRKVLNLSPWFACGLQERPGADGDRLLEEIAQHITAPERAYYHPWKMGEMLLWDNWRMLHCAAGAPVDEERYLQRTTIGGDYGLGRREPGVADDASALEYLHV